MTHEEQIKHLENQLALYEQTMGMFANALAVCVTKAGGSLKVTADEVEATDAKTLRCQVGLTEQTWLIGRPEGDDAFWDWFFKVDIVETCKHGIAEGGWCLACETEADKP